MPRQLYRAVKTLPPTRSDFESAAEKGKQPPSDDPEVLRTHDGISTFTPLERAAKMVKRFPGLGGFLAELQVPDDMPGVRCERTFPRSEGHYTVWGNADVLMTLVVEVHAVSPSAKEQKP
jgi:hypothetical protein